MNKNIINSLAALMALLPGDKPLEEDLFDNLEFEIDPDVSGCLTYMYLFLMSGTDNEMNNRMFYEFDIRYHKLDDKQKNYIKTDFTRIIETQDRNLKRERK